MTDQDDPIMNMDAEVEVEAEIEEEEVEELDEFEEDEPEETENEDEEAVVDDEDAVASGVEDDVVAVAEDEDDPVVYNPDMKKKPARRNKNSKFIDYKTFQTIARGGVSTTVKLGDEESEINLRKFESEISKDYLISFHPEVQTHNYDEIETLSTIVRNKEGQISDNFHKTLPYITKFERARILGVRTKQINNGASVMIDVPEHVIDGYTIAQMEYEQKKIPFIVKRPLPNGAVEYWKFADMEQINL
jgi:DNA-directed RNA polymerase I, II, and III subunit RPABC2